MISFSKLGNYGRLGNQMFQYAALRGIAEHNNLEWCLPNNDASLYKCFKISEGLENISDYVGEKEMIEKKIGFDVESLYLCKDNSDLLGYFQSPFYFNKIKDIIIKEYSFNDKSILKEYGFDYASIHIRRGDYLSTSELTTLGLDYYENAILALKDFDKVLVLSDDAAWCRDQQILKSDRFIFPERNEFDEMLLISNSRISVIANSTFSWWGAWIGSCDKVIAPSNWFNESYIKYDIHELIPESWTLI